MDLKTIGLQKLRDFDLGPEFIREVVATYIEEIPQYLTQAEESISGGQVDNLRRILHTLKSHSKTLCMEEVHHKLVHWEKEISNETIHLFGPDFTMIKESWEKAIEELKSLESGGLI